MLYFGTLAFGFGVMYLGLRAYQTWRLGYRAWGLPCRVYGSLLRGVRARFPRGSKHSLL